LDIDAEIDKTAYNNMQERYNREISNKRRTNNWERWEQDNESNY